MNYTLTNCYNSSTTDYYLITIPSVDEPYYAVIDDYHIYKCTDITGKNNEEIFIDEIQNEFRQIIEDVENM